MKQQFFAVLIGGLLLFSPAFASSDAPEKTLLCASCHGKAGIASNANWPHIAAQHPSYFVKQMHDFKNNSAQRPTSVMAAIAATLTEKEVVDLANYYASLPQAVGEVLQQYREQGEKIYRGGDPRRGIAACIACHGPQAAGNNWAGFPLLSGQSPLYTIEQLQAFKSKKRTNDTRQIMQDICSKMEEADIVAVAYYLSGLH